MSLFVAMGLLSSCDTPTTNTTAKTTTTPSTTTPVVENKTTTFLVSKAFNFGNDIYGQSAPVKIWLAGTFNNWVANDEAFAMTTKADGNFTYTFTAPVGTVLKFKFIIQTVNSPPAGDWWTSMTQAFDATNGPICLSPAVADVSFDADGYGGFNAVYTVK